MFRIPPLALDWFHCGILAYFCHQLSFEADYWNTTLSSMHHWDLSCKKFENLQGAESWAAVTINPFTPKSDQFQISPAALPEILHHTVWRTWLFIAYSDKRWLYSLPPWLILSRSSCSFFSIKWWHIDHSLHNYNDASPKMTCISTEEMF